jgi:hypothetical protein
MTRIDIQTPSEVGETARVLQLANQRRLADRQADGWAEREAERLAERARSFVGNPASKAAKDDPWRGAVPEFDPPPEVRTRRFGKGILVTAAGEYIEGKLKAKASPFRSVYFSSWGKIYAGYETNGEIVGVPTPGLWQASALYVTQDFSRPIEGANSYDWPPPVPYSPRWRDEAPGGYVDFDIGQLFGDNTPIVLYSGGAGQTAAIGWVFASNFHQDHPQFSRFDLTNAYRDITIDLAQGTKNVYPAIEITGASIPGDFGLPPLQNPMAAAKNYNQLTFEVICAAGGAKLDVDFNNMRLSLRADTYNLRIAPARAQSNPTASSNITDTSGKISAGRGLLHHYAITINNGEAFFHIDGMLVESYNLSSDFWTYTRGYAGASFQAGDLPIMMKAAVHYEFTEQEVITWYPGSATFNDGSTISGYAPFRHYDLTQSLPGDPPAAIQSMRFTPKPLYSNQNFAPPVIITTLHP